MKMQLTWEYLNYKYCKNKWTESDVIKGLNYVGIKWWNCVGVKWSNSFIYYIVWHNSHNFVSFCQSKWCVCYQCSLMNWVNPMHNVFQ